jgi:MFS family permease
LSGQSRGASLEFPGSKGHASQRQILSLAVFMGGLAIGSHLAARFVDRVRRPWMWCGIMEIAIGVGALAYHGLFGALTEWLWTSSVLEGMGSGRRGFPSRGSARFSRESPR